MTGSLTRYIAGAAHPLPALAELARAPESLTALSDMIGSARIVAIGESFHHTHEQLALREIFVRHLVSQLGFTTIVLEVITPGPNPIDVFVRTGVGDAESALIDAGARMWRNRETASLMAWISRRNCENATPRVSVQGMDVLAIGPLMRAVSPMARAADTQRITELSWGFDIDGRSDQIAYNRLPGDDRALLHRAFEDVFAALSGDARRFKDALGETGHETMVEQARVILDALEMLRAGAGTWTDGFALRDAAMANAVSRLVERSNKNAKFVILSHNMHVATQSSLTQPSHAPMGEHLRRGYGDAYFVFGLTFGEAHFDPPIYGVGDFPGEPSCVDQQIAALGSPCALIDLRKAEQNQSLRLQGVGLGPSPYSEYPSLNALDALAYVETLTNARQLVDTELTMNAAAVDATRR